VIRFVDLTRGLRLRNYNSPMRLYIFR